MCGHEAGGGGERGSAATQVLSAEPPAVVPIPAVL